MKKIMPSQIKPIKKYMPTLIIFISIFITVSVFTSKSLLDSLALNRTDTRLLASQWCHKNIPKGANVIRERYTLSMRKEGVREHRCRYIEKNYKNFDYVITSTKAHRRFYEKHSPYYDENVQQIYNDINDNWIKLKLFTDRELYFAHPTITIFKKP